MKIFKLIFASVIIAVSITSSYAKATNSTQDLKSCKIVSIKPMRSFLESRGKKADFEGAVFLVELDNGIKAVFKSFPKDDLGDAYGEVAAYEASVLLGFPSIPPTILRKINGQIGSLQLYVETSIDPLEPGIFKETINEIDPEELDNLKIFYFIFNQWDTGPHNILITEKNGRKHLIAIDNSGIKNHAHVKYGDLPFVRICYSEKLKTNDWDKPFPFEQARDIMDPSVDNLKKTFGNRLPNSFYEYYKAYGAPLHYVVYQNSLWRQYHAHEEGFMKSHTLNISEKTRDSIKKLDLHALKKVFSCAKGADSFTPRYLEAILERRDQVLRALRANK